MQTMQLLWLVGITWILNMCLVVTEGQKRNQRNYSSPYPHTFPVSESKMQERWDGIMRDVVEWRKEFEISMGKIIRCLDDGITTPTVYYPSLIKAIHNRRLTDNRDFVNLNLVRKFTAGGINLIRKIEAEVSRRKLTLAGLALYLDDYYGYFKGRESNIMTSIEKLSWEDQGEIHAAFDNMNPKSLVRQYPNGHRVHQIAFKLLKLEFPHTLSGREIYPSL